MTFWLITDMHLGHHNIRDYCDRPIDFEKQILANLQSYITSQDVLINLGDTCMSRNAYWHDQIQQSCAGKIWMIRGNHDAKSLSWYLDHGCDFVADSITMEIFGKKIIFTHSPLTFVPEEFINIHGHLHNNEEAKTSLTLRHRLVQIEHTYSPINLRKFLNC